MQVMSHMIECPPHLIGLLIGRGGSTIKRIKVRDLVTQFEPVVSHATETRFLVAGVDPAGGRR